MSRRGMVVSYGLWVVAVAAFVVVVLVAHGSCPGEVGVTSYRPLTPDGGELHLVQRFGWAPPGYRCAASASGAQVLATSGHFGGPGAVRWVLLGLLVALPLATFVAGRRRPARQAAPAT